MLAPAAPALDQREGIACGARVELRRDAADCVDPADAARNLEEDPLVGGRP